MGTSLEDPILHDGLEGITVAETHLSEVDGELGRLIIAGQDVEKIAGRTRFEDLAERLCGAALDLGTARVRAFEALPRLGAALEANGGMTALRAAVSQLESTGNDLLDAASAAGSIAVFAAAWWRKRSGLAAVAPDPRASHAADYLRMIRGSAADPAETRALESYLVAVSDHGMNASTFAARVVASTGSDLISALVAAIGALKGPLHGGAPGPVLDMLDAIGAPERALSWLEAELAAGRRIMGMGHRIYRVRDPRAAVLETAIAELEGCGRNTPRIALARAVERAAEDVLTRRHPDRPLRANVEFATAVLLDAIGLPRELFSPTFCVGRAIGWAGHVIEQRAHGRLIRPASRYVGPRPDTAGLSGRPG
jgi:citrate synthase